MIEAKIRREAATGEYVVTLWVKGKLHKDATAYCSDIDDAQGTAADMVQRTLSGMILNTQAEAHKLIAWGLEHRNNYAIVYSYAWLLSSGYGTFSIIITLVFEAITGINPLDFDYPIMANTSTMLSQPAYAAIREKLDNDALEELHKMFV